MAYETPFASYRGPKFSAFFSVVFSVMGASIPPCRAQAFIDAFLLLRAGYCEEFITIEEISASLGRSGS
jgi:hypothetical protein